MPSQETGKQKSQRIELDYYRQPDAFTKWKVGAALVAFVLALLLVGYTAISGGGNLANPGAVAAGHAALEQDCGKCHQTLTPIAADTVRDFSLLGIQESKSIGHTFDACTSCHNGHANPIGDHYRAKMDGDWPLVDKNCALCHADHKGRDHDLTIVADQQCSRCHDQLDRVCRDGTQTVQLADDNAAIASFTSQHGDFPSLQRSDPGTITFDHAQHLMLGQSSNGKDVIRLSDLEPELRQRYRTKMQELRNAVPGFENLDTSDDALVQLDCSSCHAMDRPGGAPASLNADSELGRYMRPISFDQHCLACHAMNPAGRGEGTLPIPHAAPWREVDQWIRAKLLANKPPATRDHPLGIGSTTATISTAEPTERQQQLERWKQASELDKAREVLFKQCQKCHDDTLIRDDAAIIAARESSTPLIPNRWLQHGIYDHAAHESIRCVHCHREAYDPGTPEAVGVDQTKVMIAGIESCVGCHRSSETATPDELLVDGRPKQVFGGHSLWASDRCTMCHRYHTPSSRSNPSFAPAIAEVAK